MPTVKDNGQTYEVAPNELYKFWAAHPNMEIAEDAVAANQENLPQEQDQGLEGWNQLNDWADQQLGNKPPKESSIEDWNALSQKVEKPQPKQEPQPAPKAEEKPQEQPTVEEQVSEQAEEQPQPTDEQEQTQLTSDIQGRYDYLTSQRDLNMENGRTETANAIQKQMDALVAQYPTLVSGQEPQEQEIETPQDVEQGNGIFADPEKAAEAIADINRRVAVFDAYTSGMVADTEERMANTAKAMASGGNTVAITSPFLPTQPLYTNITGNVYTSKLLADMDNANAKALMEGQAQAMNEREQLEAQLPQWREQLADKQKELETLERPSYSAAYLDEAPMIEGEIAQLQRQIEGAEARLGYIDEELATGNDPSVRGMVKRQQAIVDELQAKMAAREEEFQNEMQERGASATEWYNYTTLRDGDKQYAAYKLALDIAQKTLQALKDQAKREAGGEVGFWRSFGRRLTYISLWDFGLSDLGDALVKLNIASGAFKTPEEQAAAEAVLQETYYNQAVEQQFGANRNLREKGGEMTAEMLPYMLDFLISGGESALSRGAIRLGQRTALRAVGREAYRTILGKGAYRYLAEGGMSALGRELEYYIPKALGVAASDIVRAGQVTLGPRIVSNIGQVIENRVGDVEKQGDTLQFKNDKSWGRAAYNAFMDDFLESISEMSGRYFEPLFSGKSAATVARWLGAKNLSQQLVWADAGTLGDIMRQTQRMFHKVELSGLPEEIAEEYVGQALKSMIGLDTAYYYDDNGVRRNLFTSGDFHAEIWSGMAMSMGLMEVMRHGVNQARYRAVKNGLDMCDATAQELLKERWADLKEQIDNTKNEDAGAFFQRLWKMSGLSEEQMIAVSDYMTTLLAMRGMNLGQERRKAIRQEIGEDIANAAGEQRANQNYQMGYSITDGGQRNGIRNIMTAAMQQVNELLGVTEDGTVIGNGVIAEIDAALDDPAELERIIAAHSEWGEREQSAVRNYIDAKQTYDGMIQRSRDDIDIGIARQNAEIDSYTNKTTGKIQGATMKDDRKVYIIDGVVVPFDDRTGIDTQRSDGSVMVMDRNTGKVEMVSAADILITDDQDIDPEDMKQQVEDNLRASMSDEAANQINGVVSFAEGATHVVIGENGEPEVVTIVPNADGVIDNGDGTVNVTSDGGQTIRAMSKQYIQQQSQQQGTIRAGRAIAWSSGAAPQERVQEQRPQVTATPEEEGRYGLNKQIRLRDEDGNEVIGRINSRNDVQHNYQYEVEIDGRIVPMSEEELDAAYIGEVAEEEVAEGSAERAATEEAVEGNEREAGTDEILAEEEGAAQTATEETAAQEGAPQSALEQIPVDEQGNPVYEQSTPATAWDALVEQTEGDENEAQAVADDMVKDKEEALKQAQKEQKKPTQGATPAEKIAERNARAAAVAKAQSDLDFWKAVANEQQRRAEGQTQQQAPQAEQEQPTSQNEAAPTENTPAQQTQAEQQPTQQIEQPMEQQQQPQEGEQSRGSVEETPTQEQGEQQQEQQPTEQQQQQAKAQRRQEEARQVRMQAARELQERINRLAADLRQWIDGLGLNVPVQIARTQQELLDIAAAIDAQEGTNYARRIQQNLRNGIVGNAFVTRGGVVVMYAPAIYNGVEGALSPEARAQRAMERAQEVFAHEAIAHRGLQDLLGVDGFNQLCDEIYKGMSRWAKDRFVAYQWNINMSDSQKEALVGKEFASRRWQILPEAQRRAVWANNEAAERLRRGAADEYAAHLAEKVIGNETLTAKEQSIWDKIVSAIKKLFGQMDDTAIADALVQARDNLRRGEQAEPQIIGEEGERFSVEEQEHILSDVQGQKQVGVEHDLTPAQMQEMDNLNDEVRFSSKEDRLNRLGGMIRNMRPDMNDEQRNTLLDYVEGLRKEENGPTMEIATLKWYLMGNIRIPEDMQEVRRVVAIGKKAGADVTDIKRFPTPESVVDEFSQVKVNEPRANPDEFDTLTNKKVLPNGYTIYDVEDSEDGRQDMRYIIDTHLGKDHNPWCLLGGNGDGTLNRKSYDYWYDDYPRFGKKVAFDQNGKLVAFFAAGSKQKGPTWWDVQDHPTTGIPVEGKIPNDPLGRSGIYEYNIPIEDINESDDYTQDWCDEAVRLDEIDDRRNEIDKRLKEIDSLIDKIESHRAMVKAILYTIDRQLERLDDSEGTEQEKEAERARLEEERANLQAETDEYDALVDEKRDLKSERNDLDDESYELEEAVNKGASSEAWRSEYDEGINSPTEIHKGNKKNGDYTEWWDLDGKHIKEEAHYKDGKLVGEYRSYHKNGTPNVTCTYNENGRLDGKYTRRASDGRIIHYASYENGDRIGPEISYWDNGDLRSFTQFGKEKEHGYEVQDGIHAVFTYDGKLISFSRCSDGVSVGERGTWYSDGGAETYTNYEGGAEDSFKTAEWTNGGEHLISYTKYDGSNDSSQNIKFSKDGQLELIHNYKNHEQNGPQLEVWYNGTHRFTLYDNGELVGQAVIWNPQEAGARYGDTTPAPLSARETAEAIIKDADIDGVKREGEEMLERANQLRHDAADEVHEAAKKVFQDEGDLRFSTDEEVAQANERWNEELQQQIDGTQEAGHVYQLGMPNKILRAAGFPYLPIELTANRLNAKATDEGHPYDIKDLKNLPKELSAPVAIFSYGDGKKAQNVIISLEFSGKNFLVGISLNPKVDNKALEINSIRTIFPKKTTEWLGWIEDGKLLWVDKEKIQPLIGKQQTHSADVTYPNLDSVAKIIQDFENPKFGEAKNTDNGEFNTPQGEARFSAEEAPQNEDLFARAERIARDYEAEREEDMRLSADYERMEVADWYERLMSSGRYQSIEAFMDSMLSLKKVMEKIAPLKKGQHVEDIAGFENPYLGENRLSSVNEAELNAVRQLLVDPLIQAVHRLTGGQMSNYETLVNYMMAKHGLERNRYMAERDAQADYDEYQKTHPTGTKTLQDFIDERRLKDYAGLTALTGTDNVYDAEVIAQRMVDDYEGSHSSAAIKDLWDRVRALNAMTLSKQYESGFLTRANYDHIRGMYQYYIPLRGFDEETAEEEYAYIGHPSGVMNTSIQKAWGRKSKADDPIAVMQAMAEGAVLSGNRNMLVKQRFMNFVMNHPSDLVSVSELWLEKNSKGEWVPVLPPQNPDEMEKWQQDMEQKALNEPDKYAKASDTMRIPYRVLQKKDLQQHQVIVRRGGRDYILTVNGNPRLAQAINGETSPDNPNKEGWSMALLDSFGAINRALSGIYTTMNPDFIVSNFCRDMIYSNSMVWVKEKPKYARRFNKNIMRANPMTIKILFAKLRNGRLNMDNELDRLFYEFITNGGETGYARRADTEEIKRKFEKNMRALNEKLPATEIRNLAATVIGEVGRSVELCARFAAFITSREEGRDIDRSVYDGKEISVNFNKKGSGDKFFGAKGQTRIGNVSAFTSGMGRALFLFWNASLQGTFGNFLKNIARHPSKGAILVASYLALGMARAYLGAIGGSPDGDDDEMPDSYFNFSQYTRRSNLLIKGTGKAWIKIPLSIEYRAIYGLGEMWGSALFRGEKITTNDYMEQVCQLLPLDMTEGRNEHTKDWTEDLANWLKPLIPAVLKPAVEVAFNYNYMGRPIYRDKSEYNQWVPAWMRVYPTTNQTIVNFCKWMNELGNGDSVDKGSGIDINPAGVEYLLRSYVPFYTFVNEIMNTIDVARGKKDYNPMYIPLLNRVEAYSNDRTGNSAVTGEYYELKTEIERTQSKYNGYRKKAALGDQEMENKLYGLVQTPEFARYALVDPYIDAVSTLGTRIRQAEDYLSNNEKGLTEAQKQEVETLKQNIAEAKAQRSAYMEQAIWINKQIKTMDDYYKFCAMCQLRNEENKQNNITTPIDMTTIDIHNNDNPMLTSDEFTELVEQLKEEDKERNKNINK